MCVKFSDTSPARSGTAATPHAEGYTAAISRTQHREDQRSAPPDLRENDLACLTNNEIDGHTCRPDTPAQPEQAHASTTSKGMGAAAHNGNRRREKPTTTNH